MTVSHEKFSYPIVAMLRPDFEGTATQLVIPSMLLPDLDRIKRNDDQPNYTIGDKSQSHHSGVERTGELLQRAHLIDGRNRTTIELKGGKIGRERWMMRYRVLSENIYKWVEATMAEWENAGIKDEKIDDAARLFFWSVGILSWSGLEFHKYLDAAAKMLQAMREIEKLLPQTTDEFFKKEVYPAFLMTCSIALSHLADWLHEMKA